MADYANIWEMKKEDLEKKERLSKLAILDTLLAKKEPLTEAEEVVKDKLLAILDSLCLVSMGRYSYSQPSLSDDYGLTGDSSDQDVPISRRDEEELIYEELIRRDQEELSRRDQEELILQYGETARYPPQPEVEFGFPQTFS
ncbi:hypothetical protein Rs2_23820 [Raphanus sativus]|nr:hypothetical protein Rs2_23820 [Raphanus sativus]